MKDAVPVLLGLIALAVAFVLIMSLAMGMTVVGGKSESGFSDFSSCFLAEDLATRGPVQNQTEAGWRRELERLQSQCEDERR